MAIYGLYLMWCNVMQCGRKAEETTSEIVFMACMKGSPTFLPSLMGVHSIVVRVQCRLASQIDEECRTRVGISTFFDSLSTKKKHPLYARKSGVRIGMSQRVLTRFEEYSNSNANECGHYIIIYQKECA